MSKQSKLKDFLENNILVGILKKIKIPGMAGVSLFQMLEFLFKGISHHIFALRVGAVSWAFFFSLFPFLLFLFSILPFAPYYKEISTILFSEFIPNILPERITNEVVEYISETADGKSGRSISWVFILLTVLLSSNGITVLINGFYASRYGYAQRRKGINKRWISIVLTIFFVVFIIAQLLLAYYSNYIWAKIEETGGIKKVPVLVQVLNYTAASLFYFTSLCMLYYYGTNIKQKLKHIAPGAIMATILFFVTLMGFQYYVKQFNYYNFLYGSVGLVMIIMVLIYINVLLIMIGFELNASIHHAKQMGKDVSEITA